MKIGFIGHGPASGNVLVDVMNYLKLEGHEIYTYAFHPYVAELWGTNTVYDVDKFSLEDVFHQPLDMVLYGTGSSHKIELEVPLYARANGVMSISILDIFWSSIEGLKQRYAEKPDFLIVPNELTKDKIVQNGIMEKEQVHALGNPYFDRLFEMQSEVKEQIDVINQELHIAVISEPNGSGSFCETRDEIKEIFNKLFQAEKEGVKIKEIVYCPHPRENNHFYENIFSSHKNVRKKTETSFREALKANFVIGNQSTILYEMNILKKPVLYIEDILNEDIKKYLLKEKELKIKNQNIENHATKRVMDFLRKQIAIMQ